ncbi:MAG: hypothetical protein B7Z41_03970 [Rhizobiales bacterium 12-66-7]|nr:MAG: hypothetical protein B7Z41_03970 [Rhizobiales bacterium 12-66-7]
MTALKMVSAVAKRSLDRAAERLMGEGLIVQRPYAGWEVVTLNSHDVWELYTLRASLEGLAARLAARHPDRRARMEIAFDVLKAAAASGDGREITEADLSLHKTIVSLAGHQRLASQYEVVGQQVRMFMASSNAILPRSAMLIENHIPLVTAVAEGDPDLAERCAKASEPPKSGSR